MCTKPSGFWHLMCIINGNLLPANHLQNICKWDLDLFVSLSRTQRYNRYSKQIQCEGDKIFFMKKVHAKNTCTSQLYVGAGSKAERRWGSRALRPRDQSRYILVFVDSLANTRSEAMRS
jgi:hypothetical protein